MNVHRALRAGLLGAALVLGGLLLAQTAQAAPALQDDGSIRGRVFFDENDDGIFDTDESPVRGVVVRLEDEDGNTETEETSRIGIFRFDDLADGTYTVSVELDEDQADTYADADDYEDIEVSGELVSGIDFALPPADGDGAMDDDDEDADENADEEDMDDDAADDEDADDEDMDDDADDADMDEDEDEDPQAVVEQLRSLLRAADEQGITVDDLDSNLRDAIQSVIDDLSDEERDAIEQAIALDLELATLAESTGAIQLLDDVDDMDDDEGMDDEDEADVDEDDEDMDDDADMDSDSQDAAMVQDMPSTGAGDLFGWPAFLALMAVMGLLGFVGMSRERSGA